MNGKRVYVTVVFLTISLAGHLFMAYSVDRVNTLSLVTTYLILFLCYIGLVQYTSERQINLILCFSFVLRLVFLFSIPSLSDDFYRFIWDGHLLAGGHHPFARIPSDYMSNEYSIPGLTNELYTLLNSPDYFTIYPPFAQLIFWISVKISPESMTGSVVVMRVCLLIAEAVTIITMKRILQQYQQPGKRLLLYALNPLVIIEITGNLHFEGFMICFALVAARYLLQPGVVNSVKSGFFFSLAICSKLLPILFLPVLLLRMQLRKACTIIAITGIITALLFAPLLTTDFIHGFQNSVGYYFEKFEFNASIYYLVRAVGYWVKGYNIISDAGWILGLIAACLIILYSFTRKKLQASTLPALFQDWLLILTIYFLFTTTLHPWYVTTLVAFSVFTRMNYAIVWSFLIFFTYVSYQATGFQENLLIVSLEYGITGIVAVYEIFIKRSIFTSGFTQHQEL